MAVLCFGVGISVCPWAEVCRCVHGLQCLPLSFCKKQGHKWPVCDVWCFKFCRNYSRDLEQTLFWTESASEQKDCASRGVWGQVCPCRCAVSVHLWEAEIQGKVSVRSVWHLRVTSMRGWINFQHAEVTWWIPKGVIFVNKKDTRKILAVNSQKMSGASHCEKIRYCFVNKLCSPLHRSQKWAFTLETAIFDTPGSLFPAQLTLEWIHWSIIRGFPKASHFLPPITALNQPCFVPCLVCPDKPSRHVSIRKALVDGAVIR